MTRPLFDSEHIFGIHEPGGEQFMQEAGHPGWILFTEGIGSDTQNFSGADYHAYSAGGYGVICRLNNGYYPDGTIPHSSRYGDFAKRCANFVANSRGCKIWIIGNEMNYEIERPSVFAASDSPIGGAEEYNSQNSGDAHTSGMLARFGNRFLHSISGGMGDAALGAPIPSSAEDEGDGKVPVVNDDPYRRGDPLRFSALNVREADEEADQPSDDGEPQMDGLGRTSTESITPALYVNCYRQCRDAIHAVPGHEDDQVLIGAVAPWNNQTTYDGNPNGDWVQYFRDILKLLGARGCDGVALHTYTHQSDPNLVHSDAKMNPPFEQHHYEFRAYQDFMNAVPSDMRHLPIYITETDQDVAWLNSNIGWVQRAYSEIDYWNRQAGNQQIRSLILYRWPNIDRWYIEGKNGVIADFRDALQNDYRWRPVVPPAGFKADDLLKTNDLVNLRSTPGYQDKAAEDVLVMLGYGSLVQVVTGEYAEMDGLVWWQVDTHDGEIEPPLRGWLAQNSPVGVPLLEQVDAAQPDGEIGVGTTVRTLTIVRMRRTPGTVDKPANDVVADVPQGHTGPTTAGPERVDGLVWWRVRTADADGQSIEGWMAEADHTGSPLLEAVLDGVEHGGEEPADRFEIGDRFVTLDYVRVRQTPGTVNKDQADIVMDVPPEIYGDVLAGPENIDDLTWWNLILRVDNGDIQGWAAETAPNGIELLGPADEVVMPPPTDDRFRVGELVQAATYVRVRRTPGFSNKPADDVLGAFSPFTTMNIIAGGRSADGLTWWQVGGISPAGELVGWIAETAPNGIPLMQRPPKLVGTNIPAPSIGSYLGAPFSRRYGIAQLWGENPEIYGQFTYDGVPLQGHNGVDFLTPNGTALLAVDNGQVLEAVYYDLSGFGHYLKIAHSWGESLYAHMNDMLVGPGDTIVRGQLLGHSDNTGYSNGPHLHFSIRIHPFERTDGWGGFSDPLPYLNPDDFELPPYVMTPGMSGMVDPADSPAPPGTTHPKPAMRQYGVGIAPDHPDVTRP